MVDYTRYARTAVVNGKRTVVSVNHPRRPAQTLRQPGDTTIRLLAGQSVPLV